MRLDTLRHSHGPPVTAAASATWDDAVTDARIDLYSVEPGPSGFISGRYTQHAGSPLDM